jgi:hypothetical protein
VRVRDLEEDAGPVTGARIAAGGAAMRQATEDLDPLRHDVMRRRTTKVSDEPEPAGIALEIGIIEALPRGQWHNVGNYAAP